MKIHKIIEASDYNVLGISTSIERTRRPLFIRSHGQADAVIADHVVSL